MNEADIIKQLETQKDKLNRALRRTEGLKAKSKALEDQYQDAKEREKRSGDLVMELLERQRELNVMLNRANIMLNHAHEAMALTSVEFNEIAKALPEPRKAEFSDRIARINDLFKKTGAQDGEVLGLESSNPASLDSDELKKESQDAFSRTESIWDRESRRTPPQVEAELLPEDEPVHEIIEPEVPEIKVVESNGEVVDDSEEDSDDAPRRKAWWQRIAPRDWSETA